VDSAYPEIAKLGTRRLVHSSQEGKRIVISLDESGLSEPAALAATICHELGLFIFWQTGILLVMRKFRALTDLLTVYLERGFSAQIRFQFGQWHLTAIKVGS